MTVDGGQESLLIAYARIETEQGSWKGRNLTSPGYPPKREIRRLDHAQFWSTLYHPCNFGVSGSLMGGGDF